MTGHLQDMFVQVSQLDFVTFCEDSILGPYKSHAFVEIWNDDIASADSVGVMSRYILLQLVRSLLFTWTKPLASVSSHIASSPGQWHEQSLLSIIWSTLCALISSIIF
ncbi:hypothetical protein SLA2020_326830 [Shorea laevis]